MEILILSFAVFGTACFVAGYYCQKLLKLVKGGVQK